jgi:hypothetical protein
LEYTVILINYVDVTTTLSLCQTQKLSKLHSAEQIAPKERATEIIVYFTLGEIELQSKLITLLKRPLFLISFCTAAEAPA